MCIKAGAAPRDHALVMHTTLETRFGELAVEIHGAGTPFVLLHSGGHDRHDFDAITPRLSERFQTVAIDLLGHGESACVDPARMGARAVCEAAEDAVRALRLPPALVMGNSVGGMAALYLAARAPEHVRGLVLVSPSGLVEQTALVRGLCWIQGREWIRRHTGMAFARSYLVRRSAHTDAILARMTDKRRDPRFIAMEAALWRSFGRPESDLSALAPSIMAPTALVWGRRDPVIRAKVEGARARKLLPHASWIELDAGHVPFAETPTAFLEAIEPFLRPHVAPSDATSAQA
jgi:pimeloyl-ACP methyl ester carboxylesterase